MVSNTGKLPVLSGRHRYYMKIYRLAQSPDGGWLAACDNLCRICLFKISECWSPNSSSEDRKLSHFIQLMYPVYAMKTVDQLLVCGDSYGRVFAYDWAEIVKRSEVSPKTVFNFGVFDGVSLSIAGPHEINGMLYCTEKERLFVGGAGDNIVREYDINQPNKPLRLFSGHSQSVCELASAARESLLSSSADGTVRVWDIRNKTVRHVIRVADEPKVSRPSFGRCVSALAVDSSFMVCGGGVELGIWHLGSYALAGKMESANVRHLTCEMKADKILTGSMQNKLSQWNYSAEKISDVQGKTQSIYSILHTDTMSFAAGDSHLIDAYINLGYVSFSLNAFPNE